MHVEFRIIDTLDRRTPEQLRSYEDIEAKRAVLREARREKERREAQPERLPALLRPQAG